MNTAMMQRQVIKLVTSHGSPCVYTKVTTGAYNPITGLVDNTETQINITSFVEGFTASQYKYPSLIGKNTSMMYVLPSSLGLVVPAVNDTVLVNGNTFTIDSVQSHTAGGQVMLYILVGYC